MADKQLLSTVDTIKAKKQYNAYAIDQASSGGDTKSYPEWVMTDFIGKQTADTKGAEEEREKAKQ